MSTWEIEHDRTNVVCPDCAFSFDAIHQDETGGYTCPLCEPAPASGEPSGADAAVREALDAIKKAHAAVDDLCNGRRWTMSIPARPDADHDLVIDDALTKAERVIRSLTGVPTAPGAPEEGAGGMTDTEAKATPLSDAAVARIIEAVEAHCGMGRGAWDMVAARDLVEGFAAVFGADTRRVDALVEALRDCEEVLRLIHEAAGPVPKDAPMPRTTSWGAWKAAREALGLPTAPEEGAGDAE